MKRHLASLAMIICIGVGWYVWRQHVIGAPSTPPARSTGVGAALAPSGAGPAEPVGAGAGSAQPHVRVISREDRQRLVEQIAAAHGVRASHAAAAAHAAGESAPQELDDHTHDLDHLGEPVLAALQEAIPFLAACYEQQAPERAKAGGTAVAMMTLTNDPDIGAVIDPDRIVDDQQAPLDPKLDACLRSTMQTLQLPPLDAGESVKLQYSFKFDGK